MVISKEQRRHLFNRQYKREYDIKNKDKRAKVVRDRRRNRAKNGLCPQCGEVNENGTYLCYACHERRLELQAIVRG